MSIHAKSSAGTPAAGINPRIFPLALVIFLFSMRLSARSKKVDPDHEAQDVIVAP